MSTNYNPMRELPKKAQYKEGDVLVIFGEVFQRGYVNGLIEEAQKYKMKVIYSTVGRRDENNNLRPLTEEELVGKDQPLINVPLEAGFDLETDSTGNTPVGQLAGLKMSQWQEANIDWDKIEESRKKGVARFRSSVKEYLKELESYIPKGANVLFAHTMAGGFPRAKVVMPVANKVFKGIGDRYSSSKEFWDSQIGRLCELSFREVTAETFKHLIDLTADFRKNAEANNAQVSYVAYGYHGTDVLIGDEYQWQSYSPYLQGWAKVDLENISKEHYAKGIKCSVFNAPEILTNSSSIFLGVEVALYPLIKALVKEGGDSPKVKGVLDQCEALLKEDYTLDTIIDKTQAYLNHDLVKSWPSLENWPQHNGPEQMELMRNSSSELIDMHKDTKNLMTQPLSEVVFKATGKIMLHESWNPQKAVWWMGHDIVAKQTAEA